MVAAAAVVAAALVIAVRHEPEFFRGRIAAAQAPGAEGAARRLVTKLAAIHAAASRPGPWELALTEDEINAWLAIDLPRNHARILAAGVVDPRVAFEHGRLRGACRVAAGPFGAVLSLVFEVRLREVNQLELSLADARLGAIPVPRGPILHWLAGGLRPLGLSTDVRRLDGRGVLVVSMALSSAPGACRPTLEALALEPGDLLAGGEMKEIR